MTLAIAHYYNGLAVLDLVREVRPPFSPAATVAEFADVLKRFALSKATSDRYAGSWPTEAFRKVGITVEPSTRTKSEIYHDCLPLVMSGTCELLDHARLLKQFGGLERRVARGGRDSIDHAPRQHDDVANSAAGVLVLAAHYPRFPSATWGGPADYAEACADPHVGTGLYFTNHTWTHALGDDYAARVLDGSIPLIVAREAERRAMQRSRKLCSGAVRHQ
jgi:hypothetical protein